MNFDYILNGQRHTSADYHTVAARVWKQQGEQNRLHSPLAYAAFEYRCAIERVVLELYVILHSVEPSLEDVSSIGSFSGLLSKTRELAGGSERLLYRLLKFNSIVSERMPLEKTLSVPSLGKLHGLWSKLSNYCHHQLAPSETWESHDWITRGYEILDKVDDYLQHILIDHYFGAFDDANSPDEIRELRRAFVEEEIDEEQVRIRLDILEPGLFQRARDK